MPGGCESAHCLMMLSDTLRSTVIFRAKLIRQDQKLSVRDNLFQLPASAGSWIAMSFPIARRSIHRTG